MKIEVLKVDGSKSGEQVALPADVFGVEPNTHAMWLAVKAEMNNKRQGNSATKNRSAVRGGGRKPWRQKGRGTARAGTIRSPLWVGGGRVFGPSPRKYKTKMPKKVSRLARRSALSFKAKEQKVYLVEDFSFDAPKTREMAQILKGLQLDAIKTLLLTPETNRTTWLSGRNLPKLSVREAAGFSTYDVVYADTLLIQKSALKTIKEVLGK
ncbi:50S ribosomal protein L4 [bacterium I07]|nr:50S ribosomal protein L4 [bacterium I07]